MQITLTKEQVREAFGELRYMGADYCYKYDKETRKKTEEVEALKLHLGSMKLGNSVDIRLEATELPKVEPYTVVELEELPLRKSALRIAACMECASLAKSASCGMSRSG